MLRPENRVVCPTSHTAFVLFFSIAIFHKYLRIELQGFDWAGSPMIEHLRSMHDTLDLIPSMAKKRGESQLLASLKKGTIWLYYSKPKGTKCQGWVSDLSGVTTSQVTWFSHPTILHLSTCHSARPFVVPR